MHRKYTFFALCLAFLFLISACATNGGGTASSTLTQNGYSAPPVSGAASTKPSEHTPQGSSTLILYFSRTGNTQTVAGYIADALDADMVEIVPVAPYPEEYEKATAQAQEELNEGIRPAITVDIEGLDGYDTILLGYPIWWGTIPMPVAAFLEAYDFTGITIYPFCTHGGSGLSTSVTDIAQLAEGATIGSGFAVRGTDAVTAEANTAAWLRETGLLEG